MSDNCTDFDENSALMLSSAGTGRCAYKSPSCRHGGVTSQAASDFRRSPDEQSSSPSMSLSAPAVVEPDASWWPADASTSQFNAVDPARCLAVSNSCHPSSCVWTQMKYQGVDALSRQGHNWTINNWPSNFDDLLPTSETYKWMTIRRSGTKNGTLTSRVQWRH